MELIRGKIPCAKKVVVYGPEGIGKSTFAAHFPNPVFIDTEGSTKDMDVVRTPTPSSWEMLKGQVKYFIDHPGELQTLVIDTADWAEMMCNTAVCTQYQKGSIEEFGYGKGYTYLQEEFGRLLNLLTDLVEKKGVNVVLNAHAKMRKFEQPDELGAYDRWEMKMSKNVAPMIKEWADMVLFCNYKTFVTNVDGQGAQKGKNKAQGGKRVMYTSHHPCWDAKNRYGLQEEVPFDYASIAHIIPISSPLDSSAVPTTKPVSQLQKSEEERTPAKNDPVSPPEKKTAPIVETKPEPIGAPPEGITITVDGRVKKNLRDLMIANGVCEWDVQNVVGAKGYFPADMEVYDYPDSFVDGCLVARWTDQVYPLIKEMKDKDAIPFN